MVEDKRETVVVEGDRSRSSVGWIVALIVLLVLAFLFFMNGGFGLFGGSNSQGGDTINVDTPDSVNVTPTPEQ